MSAGSADEVYCPVCGRHLVAINPAEVERGEDDGYIYVHDGVPHTDCDMEALERGLQ